MKLGSAHISMIGVGVSAVAAIAMVLYYRNQATQAAATADTGSGMGAFPYFQTAALPSGAGGGGTVTAAAAPALDIGALVTALGTQQAATTNQTNLDSLIQSFIPSLTGFANTQANQQARVGQVAALTTGYVGPTAGGGLTFGVSTVPLANLVQTSDSINAYLRVPPNSTNSTQPPATIVH